jgi:hypothetical protein
MKTFKLKMLKIMSQQQKIYVHTEVPLIDGLIINREDDHNHWLIEAYIDIEYLEFFKQLHEKKEETIVQVKITKESNEPAFFITSIVGVNEIGESSMNVLLLGTIVEENDQSVGTTLSSLINKEQK